MENSPTTYTTNEDLKFNIERANEIVRLYQQQIKHFLELNFGLMALYTLLLGVLFLIFNNLGGKTWGTIFKSF